MGMSEEQVVERMEKRKLKLESDGQKKHKEKKKLMKPDILNKSDGYQQCTFQRQSVIKWVAGKDSTKPGIGATENIQLSVSNRSKPVGIRREDETLEPADFTSEHERFLQANKQSNFPA